MGLVNRLFKKLAVVFVITLVAMSVVPKADDLNRADPCALAPAPEGNATGLDRRCGLGASNGVARGDFNGDGFADLAIGVPDETRTSSHFNGSSFDIQDHPRSGAVNIVYGSSNGLTSAGSQVLDQGLLNNATDAHYGRALAAGHFRGSLFTSDLAVGVPGAKNNGKVVGAIDVHFSSSGKLSATPNQTFFANQFTVATTFGTDPLHFPDKMAMTWGDFNGDGAGDLAVSAIACHNNSQTEVCDSISRVLVLYGAAFGGLTNNFTVLTINDGLSPTNLNLTVNPCSDLTTQANDRFCGKASGDVVLAAADLTGDGRDDLLIGAPGCFQVGNSGSRLDGGVDGCVAIVPGTSAGLKQRFNWNVLLPEHDIDERAAFGSAIAIGDFDADGVKDVAVGAPNNQFVLPDNAGMVRVFSDVIPSGIGQEEASFDVPSTLLIQSDLGIETSELNDRFGASLASKDFNGDGAADLAIGVPGESTGSATSNGQVDVIYGQSGIGLSGSTGSGQQVPQVFNGNATGEAFGAALSAWNFGKSIEGDLAIGIPFRTVLFRDSSGRTFPIAGAGAVRVLYGATTSPMTAQQTWTQSTNTPLCTTCTAGTVAAGNHFGASLY
jgi:hypothetical protein